MRIHDKTGIGEIDVRTLPLPDGVKAHSTTYTYSGSVLVTYRKDGDPENWNYVNVAVMNDDGTNFRNMFSGDVSVAERVNGVRYMPFADNKRVLLGSWVMECTPDIDHFEKVELIPIEYPKIFDSGIWLVWSEVIISPDNLHMAWTQLHAGLGSLNYIGELHRQKDKYTLENVQLISSLYNFKKDPEHVGDIIPQILRGGELKQFVRGGTALSMQGSCRAGTSDSVVQDMATEAIWQITQTLGYDETTIFSPDEKLGLVMSSRFSPRSDMGIFALMPRPLGPFSTYSLIMPIYCYSIMSVRSFKGGNIGPALIEIEKSKTDPEYQGVCLADPDEEEWVYCSPMSWSPDGKKGMWTERLRGTNEHRNRICELLDYVPAERVSVASFPEKIPYAITDMEALCQTKNDGTYHGIIRGKAEGFAEYHGEGGSMKGKCYVTYHHYSDDGKVFWDGYENTDSEMGKVSTYRGDVIMSGEQEGRMDIRATFVSDTPRPITTVHLDFGIAEDGKPATYGYSTYGGKTLNMENYR